MVRPEDPDELKVGKYTADILTADGEFILSLPAFYDDVAETVKAAKDCLQENSDYVKDTGLVPSKIHVTTVVARRGWNMPQFVKDVDLNATEAKKPTCSMQKKKESLLKKSEAHIDEMTFKQAVNDFISCAPDGGWSDYWSMQQDWSFYVDGLCRDGVITRRQAEDVWTNPCTPETFDRWQKRNGLVRRRGY